MFITGCYGYAMQTTNQSLLDLIFKDKKGHIVLWQSPNIPLYAWIVFKILGLVLTKGYLKNGVEQLSSLFLFTWAYLEIMKGVDYFRKALGLVVLISVAVSYFK